MATGATAANLIGEPTIDRAARPDVDDVDTEIGLPTPCPQCGGDGYLAHIDLPRGKKHESCHSCGHWWSTPLKTHAQAHARQSPFERSSRTGLAERLQGRRVSG